MVSYIFLNRVAAGRLLLGGEREGKAGALRHLSVRFVLGICGAKVGDVPDKYCGAGAAKLQRESKLSEKAEETEKKETLFSLPNLGSLIVFRDISGATPCQIALAPPSIKT
ncbi:hypothetical protein CEXT_180911 [Caerostris extrusa]|uniref:Uncharacterized protein n=1 Tax=Caerostris extrusa TaxID=172846 RepID=A0AAV4XBP0_CAEEX|nr:hypothetical protein CEXT_180911 [Caerostris extrusa]